MHSDRITQEAQKHRVHEHLLYTHTPPPRTHADTHACWRMAAIRWGNQACEDRGALRGCNRCMERVCACAVCVCVYLDGFYPSNAPSIRLNINTVSCVTGQWLRWGANALWGVNICNHGVNMKRSGLQHYRFATINCSWDWSWNRQGFVFGSSHTSVEKH